MAYVYFRPWSWTATQAGQYLAGLAILSLFLNFIYRLFFHPISKCPGPKLWAVTALRSTYCTLRGTKSYKISELHNRYGPIVRVGPFEVSYISEVAEKNIYSSHRASGGKQLGKWKFTPPSRICRLFNNPSDSDHARLRKILGVALSDKAVREREPFLQDYISLFIQRLREQPIGKVDITYWLGCIGFDTVAHVTFGASLNGLETSTLPELATQNHDLIVNSSRQAGVRLYFLGRLLYKCFPEPPNFAIRRRIFAGLLGEREKRRIAGKNGENRVEDLITIMSNKIGKEEKGLSEAEMSVVSSDVNIAGSDTTASALSATIFHLLTNTSKLQALVKEIRSSFATEAEIKSPTINTLKYLNAVINETMRLNSPAPETTRRITNPGGNTICGDLIPAGIRVGIYRYAAGHYVPAWKNVEDFVPGRWLGEKEYEGDQLNFVNPFATGPRNCIGQTFATVYMRLLLARLFWNFDLEICDESRDWLDMKVYSLIIEKGPIFVKLKSIG